MRTTSRGRALAAPIAVIGALALLSGCSSDDASAGATYELSDGYSVTAPTPDGWKSFAAEGNLFFVPDEVDDPETYLDELSAKSGAFEMIAMQVRTCTEIEDDLASYRNPTPIGEDWNLHSTTNTTGPGGYTWYQRATLATSTEPCQSDQVVAMSFERGDDGEAPSAAAQALRGEILPNLRVRSES